MKKLVIFDLDGTLFNTTEAMKTCGNEALQRLGLPLLEGADYASFSGAGVEEYVNSILDKVGDREHHNARLFWEYYTSKNEAEQTELIFPYDGIKELLFDLKERGIRLAVLSNKNENACIPIIKEKFGEGIFDLVRGERKNTPPKPDPTGALETMEFFSALPEECLYVGDTQVDMLTGKNAKIPTVAVLWGYRTKEVLSQYSPEFFAEKPEDILHLIEESK
ncbi:MAG: HAD family hydrolase [Clostridia bacterium]|nr:HAD family hydrolase [Clostridia bacterium]